MLQHFHGKSPRRPAKRQRFLSPVATTTVEPAWPTGAVKSGEVIVSLSGHDDNDSLSTTAANLLTRYLREAEANSLN